MMYAFIYICICPCICIYRVLTFISNSKIVIRTMIILLMVITRGGVSRSHVCLRVSVCVCVGVRMCIVGSWVWELEFRNPKP